MESRSVSKNSGDINRVERFKAGVGAIGALAVGALAVGNRTSHELDRLLCRVIKLVLVRTTHDELRRRRVPDGRVLASFAESRCIRKARCRS